MIPATRSSAEQEHIERSWASGSLLFNQDPSRHDLRLRSEGYSTP